MSASPQRQACQPDDRPALGPLVVTDLELCLLEEAHHRLLADTGRVGQGVEESEPAGEVREAFLSLAARGLLDKDGELSGSDDLSVLVTTVLDVRLAADLVLGVERVRTDGTGGDRGGTGTDRALPDDPDVRRDIRLVHVLDSGACVEDLLPDGSHHLYLLLDRGDVVPWVTAVTVPRGAVAGTGPVLTVHPDRPEEIPMVLGRPSVLAELWVFVPGEDAVDALRDGARSPAHHLLALGTSGSWVTDVDAGRSLPETVLFRPVDPGWVEEWARSVLDAGPAGDVGGAEVGRAQ